MCTPCSKPHPPPNWRSRSRVVVTSYQVFFGSGTGAVHTHMVYIIIRMSVFHVHLVPLYHPVLSLTPLWLKAKSQMSPSLLLICITLLILPCYIAPLEHMQLYFFNHQLRKNSMLTCKTVEYCLSGTSSNFLQSNHLKLTTCTLSPCPPTFPLDMLANVPVYLWWVTSSVSVHSRIVHPHTFVHTYVGMFTIMHTYVGPTYMHI